MKGDNIIKILLILIIVSNITLAANDPGHDTLYIEQQGESQLNGTLNVTNQFKVSNLVYSSYLDILGNGSSPTSSYSQIYATTTDLRLNAPSALFLLRDSGSMVYIGTSSVDLNVSRNAFVYGSLNVTGTIFESGSRVCSSTNGFCNASGGNGNLSSSGTANYVPLFSSNALLINSLLYQTAGKIGIGTITPSSALHVVGDVNITNNEYINGSLNVSGTIFESGNRVCTASNGFCAAASINGTDLTVRNITMTGTLIVDGINISQQIKNDNTTQNTLILAGFTNDSIIFALQAANNITQNTLINAGFTNDSILRLDNNTQATLINLKGNLSSTGSANYIPLFQNGTALNNSIIYQAGTNIGIGTSSATNTLSFSSDDVKKIWIEKTNNLVAGKSLTIEAGSTINTGNVSNFTALSQTSRAWYGMAAAPNGNIYAVTYSGDIYMQTNSAGTFNALSQTSRTWYGMAAAPNGNIYATAYTGDIYMQTAGTGNFIALNQTSRQWITMTAAPNGNIYAAVYNGDIYMQTAGTGNFTALGGTNRAWYGMAAAPNGNIYAAAEGGDIYMQTNGAGSFNALSQTSRTWRGMTAASNGNIYAAVASGDIYMQTAGTGNFIALNQTARAWLGMAAAPNGNVYAGANGGDIYMQTASTGTLDLAGGNLILSSGQGKGNGTSSISFLTGTTLSSGISLQTLSEKMVILGNGNVGIGTTSPSSALHVVGNVNITNNEYINGSLNVSGTIFESGNRVCTSANGFCAAVGGNGNVSSVGSTGYIPQFQSGTTLNNSVIYQNGSNIGIGRTGAAARLDIDGTTGGGGIKIRAGGDHLAFIDDGEADSSVNYWIMYRGFADGALRFLHNNNEIVFDSTSNIGIKAPNPTATLQINSSNNAGNLWIHNTTGTTQLFVNGTNGRVGIGTTTPNYGLDIMNEPQVSLRLLSTGSNAAIFAMDNAAGGQQTTINLQDAGINIWQIGKQTTNEFFIWDSVRARNAMIIYPLSNVTQLEDHIGLGTWNAGSTRLAIQALSTASPEWIMLLNSTGTATWQIRETNPGDIDFTETNVAYGRLYLKKGGNIGIGTTTPAETLQIHDTGGVDSALLLTTTSSGTTVTDGLYVGITENNSSWVWNYENGKLAFGTNNTEKMTILGNGNVGIGTIAPSQALHVTGNANITGTIYYGGNLTGYGADFAENFEASEKVNAGDVVCLNENMKVEKCKTKSQKSVAGVVSTRPTIIGNGAVTGAVVGIVGIVPTKVVGPIERFELLTTSDKPGYAQKATINDFGSIIGKTMESCSQKECMIKVLVSLG